MVALLPQNRNFTTLEKCLLLTWIVVLIPILVILVAIAFIYIIKQQNGDSLKYLLKTLDESIDPCNDFYDFVCNKYVSTTFTKYNGELHVDNFNIINDKVRENVTHTLNQDIEKNEWKPSILAKTFYRSCLNAEHNKINKTFIIKQMEELGGWPVLMGTSWNYSNFTWTNLMYKFRKKGYMTGTFVNFDVVPDINNINRYVVQLSPPLLFGLDKAYLLKSGKKVEAYFELMVNIAETLGANKSDAQKQLKESLKFEIQIAQISSLSYSPDQIIQMSISDLQQRYGFVSWLEYINNLLPKNVTLNSSDVVHVLKQEYLSELNNLLLKTEKRIQANYAIWRTILEKISYYPEDISTLYMQASDIIGDGMKGEIRKVRCTMETYQSLPDVLNAMYLRYFDKNTIGKVNEIVRYLKSSFGEIILDVEWMDFTTKMKALEKLREMQISVDYDSGKLLVNYYKDLQLDPTDYFNNSLKVYILRTDNRYRRLLNNRKELIGEDEVTASASYYPTRNRVSISAAILQPPFFSESFPMYINFGSLGMIIGHEIIHGFDDIGCMYDKNGNIHSWWSKLTADLYKNQTECLISQYSNYKSLNMTVNGTSTLNENVADNGGIQLAFLAYYNWLKDHKEETTGNAKYSARQMFWIYSARSWCASYTEEYLNDLIKTYNKYPPSKFRVIGPFSNSEEFAVSFNCSRDSNMNPTKKCLMW